MSHRAADGLGGHPGTPGLFGEPPGDFAVGHGLAVGNPQKDLPYRLPERGADRVQRRQEIRLFSGKINVQPAFRFREGRGVPFNALLRQTPGKILLPVKPQAAKSNLICRQQDAPQGRVVMLRHDHFRFLPFSFSVISGPLRFLRIPV